MGLGDWGTGRLGDQGTGGLGDWGTGRLGDWETGGPGLGDVEMRYEPWDMRECGGELSVPERSRGERRWKLENVKMRKCENVKISREVCYVTMVV
jgi:hypothetical protein